LWSVVFKIFISFLF